jgi:hypothetical protein
MFVPSMLTAQEETKRQPVGETGRVAGLQERQYFARISVRRLKLVTLLVVQRVSIILELDQLLFK